MLLRQDTEDRRDLRRIYLAGWGGLLPKSRHDFSRTSIQARADCAHRSPLREEVTGGGA